MFRHPENEYDWQSSDAAVDEVRIFMKGDHSITSI
ncbi:hypothetical protein AE53_02546, partial [Escherichia coli BIDMC 78]